MAQRIEDVSHLDWRELREVLDDQNRTAIVIDVREPEEYEEAHIDGLPLIPMGDIIDWTDIMDPQREYIFVCRSGRRSLEVAKYFQRNGFGNVHNFLGGMLSWREEGNEIAKGPALPIESCERADQERGSRTMSMSEKELLALQPDHIVDAIGEVCPHTLNLALESLKKAKSGEIVVEVTDHSIATKTIPAAVKMNKIGEFLGVAKKGGEYHIFVKKA